MPVLLQRNVHLPSIYWPRKFGLIALKMETGNGGPKKVEVMAINLNEKNVKNKKHFINNIAFKPCKKTQTSTNKFSHFMVFF